MHARITIGPFWWVWLFAWFWAVLLGAESINGALADDRPDHSLEFVDQDALALELATNTQSVTTTIAVRNNGPRVAQVQLFAALQDSDGNVTNIGPVMPQPATAEGFRVTLFTLSLPTTTSVDLTGHLTINGVNSTVLPGVRAVSIRPAFVPPRYIPSFERKDVFIWAVALCFATFLSVVATFWPRGLDLGKAMEGPPSWDIKGSWATNLTAVGAVLNFTSAENILPETTHYLTTAQYSTLALLFGALALIAPAIFIFINRLDSSQHAAGETNEEPATEPTAKSWVWVFLLASAVTLWAVYGQLLLALFILDELRVANALSTATFVIFALVVMSAGLLLMWYAPQKIGETARYEPPPQKQTGVDLITMQAAGETLVVTSQPRAARSWPLL